MSTAVQQAPPSPSPPPSRHRGDRVRSAIRGVGELFITVGLVMLLLVVYEVYWTNLVSAGKQQAAASTLDQEWAKGDNPLIAAPNPAPAAAAAPAAGAPAAQRTSSYAVAPGQGFAKLYIPSSARTTSSPCSKAPMRKPSMPDRGITRAPHSLVSWATSR